MTHNSSIYDELNVPQVINAAGTKTRIGGSLIRPKAVEAMSRAAEGFVRISDLQMRASDLIAECTGAEAGYVTSGAAAAMTLGAAACIAGDELSAMNRLPDTAGLQSEVVMPRTHRTGYDHAIRAAGAAIVDVGTNDPHLGTGSAAVEPWEIEAAITEDTAAIAYLQKEYTKPPLPHVVDIAHRHEVPVLVDAAAEVPPKGNLTRFIDEGADLVIFSGGKGIRGPQSTGILAGRSDLIESVAFQNLDMHAPAATWDPPSELVNSSKHDGVPKQGIGRGLKVGKEEIVGLIRALELFLEEDEEILHEKWNRRIEIIESKLSEPKGITCERSNGDKANVAPVLCLALEENDLETTAVDLALSLRRENPRVFVGDDAVDEAQVVLNPMCLTDKEAEYVAERIYAYFV